MITTHELQTAMRLLLPGGLAKHAVSEGSKQQTKYTNTQQIHITRFFILYLLN